MHPTVNPCKSHSASQLLSSATSVLMVPNTTDSPSVLPLPNLSVTHSPTSFLLLWEIPFFPFFFLGLFGFSYFCCCQGSPACNFPSLFLRLLCWIKHWLPPLLSSILKYWIGPLTRKAISQNCCLILKQSWQQYLQATLKAPRMACGQSWWYPPPLFF